MRKILLATSALVAFAGAAQAAESPIAVNVGGYVDFRAAQFTEASKNFATTTQRRDHDFETEYRLNISAEGKAANGIEYGGLISLWNGADYTDSYTGGGNRVHEDQAYVWMSGAFGKAILGDDHGASDLFVFAPTVGEGQIDGSYTDFTDPGTLWALQPAFFNETENSTKITYYTPKVGNANHKVQAGVSFAPNFNDQGQNVVKYRTDNTSARYQDNIEGTLQYTGNFSPVTTVVSALIATGAPTGADPASASERRLRAYTGWGLGAQASYAGFTLGGSYVDAGRLGTFEDTLAAGEYGRQNKQQDVWTLGLKYEFDKVALAVNGMRGQGYNNSFSIAGHNVDTSTDRSNYVKDFSAIGLGATYTWFPGLTTAADAVFFDQTRDDFADDVGTPMGGNEG
ncbi:MAG: porin, partial [Alphaproteobacteria bacterium]|nr:porin [Alphaproteobacteria bacterium]